SSWMHRRNGICTSSILSRSTSSKKFCQMASVVFLEVQRLFDFERVAIEDYLPIFRDLDLAEGLQVNLIPSNVDDVIMLLVLPRVVLCLDDRDQHPEHAIFGQRRRVVQADLVTSLARIFADIGQELRVVIVRGDL